MLDRNKTALVIVDVQGKLASLMSDSDTLYQNLSVMTQGAKALQLPVIWLEQLPDKLGPTIPQIAEHLTDQTPIAKNCFSGCQSIDFMDALVSTGCKNVLLVGIEAHICVYQTAMDLLRKGYHVEVISDAVSSRNAANKTVALNRMQQAGASISCTEMVLFELQGVAEGESFRQILNLIK
ncbi:hydrolase [Photobacterium sp. WH24]|uniref:Hydrolase n=1 Tax=Photobacterium arenosum TaxID=2774143 RepID=A0ABR9BGH9_9GAMM|nr:MULTISPECIES: hydrolase [Photobacterium]MBD8511328.1 hydrolase [Photobacterium arenosum]MBV7262983.1 hydrolase [Photobacterium sp. WH24]